MRYATNVDWPGRNVKGVWDELKFYVSEMAMNTTISVELENEKLIEHAIRAVFQKAEDMGCKEQGWRFQTTRRGKTVFIRKISVTG
jgi:hypothetical protein